ncbi:MAG: hypothetical protein VYC34_03130, partial [Planctomycetota bacterium]|nr:hypothetical protein [Planctomycetota bacterium]
IPHINDLAAEYRDKDVKIIGVAIWPRDNQTPTDEFVEEKGDEMDYLIAEAKDGKIAEKFMDATGNDGIPTAMIIDREGRLAWFGHPMAGLDTALEEIVEGTYDLAANAERLNKEIDEAAQEIPIITQLRAAQAKGDWETVLASYDQLLSLNPDKYGQMHYAKFMTMLVRMNEPDRAYAFARERMKNEWKDDAQALNGVAWSIATEEGIEQRDLDLALKAAERSNELAQGNDPSILDTVAAVHFARGDVAKAIEYQEKAVSKAWDPGIKQQLQERLDTYKEAAGAM